MLKKIFPFLIILLPSILAGMLVGAYPGYKMYEYTWKDPNFCMVCHVHDYATVGWQKSIHGQKTTCHDCHHQPLRAYLKEMYVMITKRPKFPLDLHHTPYVKEELCAACHLALDSDHSTITGPMSYLEIQKIPKVDTSYLHKIHLEKRTKLTLLNAAVIPEDQRSDTPVPFKELPRVEGVERKIVCADCHGGPMNRGHSFSAVEIACVRCHEKKHSSNIVGAYGCRQCHFSDFLAPVSSGQTYNRSPRVEKEQADH